jgi:hypothetical protein
MANAQQASTARATDPSAGIAWSRNSDEYKKSSGGGKSIMDRAWNDNMSVGKRIIDVLSRGNYASANVAKEGVEQGLHLPAAGGLGLVEALVKGKADELVKAGWEGATGRDKTTYSDVIDTAENKYGTPDWMTDKDSTRGKWGRGLVAFGADVVADPTTYIGAGAVVKPVKALLKSTGKSAKITEAAIKSATQRAVEEMVTTGSATVPVGKADDFVRNVTRNVQTPGEGIFDQAVKVADNAPALTGKILPEGERVFTAGADGIEETLLHPNRITDERFQLPGPSADVLVARSKTAQLDQLAKGIPQFEYGSAVDDLDEFGPFRETIEREPISDVPQVRPVGTAEKTAGDDWSDLPEVTNPNPIRNAILRKPDEPVFSKYEKAVDANGVEYFKPAEDAVQTTVGELRRIIAQSGDARAKQVLLNHLKTVETYAENLAAKGADITGYGTAKGYVKDLYPEQWEAARVALGGRKAKGELDLSPLPEGPMAVKPKEPTFREIKKIEKMDMVDKMIYLHTMSNVLSPKDISYLASASNPKSFATRMQKIKTRVRSEGTKDVRDLLEAIREGRIQSPDEPGIAEIMQETGAKSLEGLARKLEQHLARQSKAEQKMLGRITEPHPVTKETRSADNAVKELGPTGLPYSAYGGRAAEALENAKKIIDEKVEPAAKIVEDAKQGNKAALMRPAAELNVEQTKIFDRAMKWAVEQDVIQPRNKEIWAELTRRGVLRTSKIPNAGKGRYKGAWNKYSQYTFFKDIMDNAEKIDPAIKQILDDAGIKGGDRAYMRASAMYDMMMPVLKAMDDVLKQGGVFPVADRAIGDNPFSLFDVLHAVDPDFAKRMIFNLRKTKSGVGSYIAPTQLMDVVNYMVDVTKTGDGLGADDIETVKNLLLEKQVTRNGNAVPNGLADMLRGKKPEDVSARLDEVVATLADGMPEIVSRVERNLADRKLYHEDKVARGTKESLEVLADTITDPTVSPADIAGLADNIKVNVVDKVARLRGIDADDAWMVTQEVIAKMPELGMPAEVAAQGKVMNKMAAAKTKSERVKVGVQSSKIAEEESAKIAEEMGIPLSDMGTRFEMTMGYKFLKAFSPHLSNKDVRPFFLDRKSLTQSLGRGYQSLISDINKAHTKQNIALAWKEAQNGTRSANPDVAKAQDALQQAINTFFSKDPAYNVFSRNNISADDINEHFARKGIHEKYRFTDDTLNDAWRTWDTDNPLDLLAKTQAATMDAMAKRLLGDDLTYRFGSSVKKEGYVKLADHNSVITKYLDLDQYYPRDIAKQFKVLDDFLKETMEPVKFNAGLNMLDNVLHSYKAGLTIYRPGHHVRNMVGDLWLSHMAGVNDPRYYTKAAKVMAQNHGRYRDFDAIQALMARQPVNNAKVMDNSPIAHVTIGGKKHALSASEVYRAAYDQGILNDYRTLEDIQMGAESFSDTLRKVSPFKGKANKTAASFSEARDHYVRLAHFMNDIEKGNYKSLDEAITKAAHNVRKWHPDGSDLTGFESKVMRRTFLFYSWIRKAMPLVVESMVMKPGKVMIYPKAMYNIAEANGIDLDSMSNPYPQDTLFPDWITDSPIGPFMQNAEGHYMGANPGVPFVDVLNDYAGTQAGPTVFGSTNPFLKIPSELAMSAHGGDQSIATDWRTGIKAYDKSDYADRQIPGFGYAANITGRSPSQGFMQAKGGPEKDPAEQRNPLAFYNLLSGMGVFDMSKPSYQRQAKEDAKARYKASQGDK